MTAPLTPYSPASRLAALGLAALLAIILWFAVIIPVVAGATGFLAETSARIQLAAHLSAYTDRHIAAGGATTADQVTAQAVAVPTGVSADQAAASMQSQLRALLARSGHDLQTFEFLGADRSDGLERLSMLVQFQAPLDTMVDFLDAVEGQEIGMRIDELIIQADERRSRRAPTLDVSVEVSAFRPMGAVVTGGAP